MDDEIQRRTLLGWLSAGVAVTAGCGGRAFDGGGGTAPTDQSTAEPGTTGDPAADPTSTATPTETPHPATEWGLSIPTYPYRETAVSPLDARPDPEVSNPVLTASSVKDVDARFVADPFLFVEDGEWHMFFEVLVNDHGGVIAHATSPDRGVTWQYDQVVLRRLHHLSFPYVFKWNGEYYMTTEEQRSDSRDRLYRATSFPTSWTDEGVLYDPPEGGSGGTDHVLFRWDGRWWSLAGVANEHTYAYYSDSLSPGGWTPHENNPVVSNRPEASRLGGRPIVREDGVTVFFQDLVPFYGESVRAYRITDLSPTAYADHELFPSPVIDGTGGESTWNGHRMHHFDPWHLGEGDGWRVAVDGDGTGDARWTIGIYRVPGPESESNG